MSKVRIVSVRTFFIFVGIWRFLNLRFVIRFVGGDLRLLAVTARRDPTKCAEPRSTEYNVGGEASPADGVTPSLW